MLEIPQGSEKGSKVLGKHFQMFLLKIIKWYWKYWYTSANPNQISVCLTISTLAEMSEPPLITKPTSVV